MTFKVLMTVMFLCLISINQAPAQVSPEKWLIKHVVLETDPNPRFIRLIAENVVLSEAETTSDHISCLKQELLKTGLFKRIDSRLYKLKEAEGYDLILTTEFESSDLTFVLNRITVIGVDGVDKNRFDKLASSRLIGQQVSLDTAAYMDFVEKVFDLLKKSIKDDAKKQWMTPPWIELKSNAQKELEVTISPVFKGCEQLGQSKAISMRSESRLSHRLDHVD